MIRQANYTMNEEEAIERRERFFAYDPSVPTQLLTSSWELECLVKKCGYPHSEASTMESEEGPIRSAIRCAFPEIEEYEIAEQLVIAMKFFEAKLCLLRAIRSAFHPTRKPRRINDDRIKDDRRVTFLVSNSLLNLKHNCSRSRRSPVRSAAKSGGDDGGGDGDSDGPGEPPRPVLTAPPLHISPVAIQLNSFILSWIVHPCYCCMGGRWTA